MKNHDNAFQDSDHMILKGPCVLGHLWWLTTCS